MVSTRRRPSNLGSVDSVSGRDRTTTTRSSAQFDSRAGGGRFLAGREAFRPQAWWETKAALRSGWCVLYCCCAGLGWAVSACLQSAEEVLSVARTSDPSVTLAAAVRS